MINLKIEKLLTIDETGMPKAPNIRQLQDKDVLALYARDKSSDKRKYISEVGVIYYLGDPKSPARQQGLSDKEALKMAIENYDLPKTYEPDVLVKKLIDKYYTTNITEAGLAIEILHKSIHLVSIAAKRINDMLNAKLSNPLSDDEMISTLSLMDNVSKKIVEIPALTKSLMVAYENLQNEEENKIARGGQQILSSMDADEII